MPFPLNVLKDTNAGLPEELVDAVVEAVAQG